MSSSQTKGASFMKQTTGSEVRVSIVRNESHDRSPTSGQMWRIVGFPEEIYGRQYYRHLQNNRWLVLTSHKSNISESGKPFRVKGFARKDAGETQFNVCRKPIGLIGPQPCNVYYFGVSLIVIDVSQLVIEAQVDQNKLSKTRQISPVLNQTSSLDSTVHQFVLKPGSRLEVFAIRE